MARVCKDDKTDQITQEIIASYLRDKLFTDALNNQNKVIEILVDQLSRLNVTCQLLTINQ